MHSGFEIPGIQSNDNTCTAPVLLSMNQSTTHILEQIHGLPTTQQLFLEHHLLPHYSDAAGPPPPYFPAVNFKLGLNEICSRNEERRNREALQFEVPKTRHSLGIPHCWNETHCSLKQQPFWEPLPAEVSNENSEIVDRQEHMELNHKQQQQLLATNLVDGCNKVQFGELEAIYKRCEKTNQSDHLQMTQMPSDYEHVSESSKKRRKKKKKKDSYYYSRQLMNPMAEFFGNFVKQMMDHQESLHNKFTEMIERLDEERRVREEYWRNQEMVHFEQESLARAREKTLARNREAMIVSYLEKITGQKVNFGGEITSTSNEMDHGRNGESKAVCS